jgi:hypothetical protein
MKHYYSLLLAFALLFIFCPSNLLAQDKKHRFPLRDAIHYSSKDSIEKVKVLNAYDEDSNVWADNKFIDASGLDFNQKATDSPVDVQIIQSGAAGNPLGGPLIDALGTVIAKRFKEELTLAFLNNFRDKLKDEKQSYLGELFPNAKLILLYDDPFNHKVWLSSFRGALDEDLRVLPDNMPSLLKEIKSKTNLDENQTLIIEVLLVSYSPVNKVFKNPKQSFLPASSFLKDLSQIKFQNENLSAGLILMSLLIEEMGNTKSDNWAKIDALDKLKNQLVAETFIGLTIEKHKEALEKKKVKNDDGKDIDLYTFLNDSYAKIIGPVRNYITSVVDNVEAISDALNDLQLLKKDKNEKGEQLVYSDFVPLMNKSIENLKLLLDDSLIESMGFDVSKFSDILERIESSSNFVSTLNESIDSKEYSKIVVNVLSFISENIPEDKLESSAALLEFTKYTSFAVNLVGAETSTEMTAAIESGILPVQSYRLKRNISYSISVNSFAGVFVAREFLLNDDAKNETSGLIGFTAPIGIAFNLGFNTPKIEDGLIVKKNKKLLGSISLYATLLDVGAITTFRLTNDEDPVEGVEWKNVFAPGLYLVFGIQNTPLAFSIGGQYGPELRSVESIEGVGTPTIDTRAFRFGASLTVDIPLLHLYSRQKNIK